MLTLNNSKPAVAVIAGLTLVGALAGCAPTAEPAPEASTPSSEKSTTAPEADKADVASTYTDGTYTESGSYQSPHGVESVDVTVTLEADVITSVEVVGHGDNPDSQHYQGEFIGGISAAVVGKDIDSISVTKVAGSSLTSGGFTEALDAIKADATA